MAQLKTKATDVSVEAFLSRVPNERRRADGLICMTGFSPRGASLVLYVLTGFPGQAALLKRLGKHKTGKGCLYINKLADVDMSVLKQLVTESYRHMKARQG